MDPGLGFEALWILDPWVKWVKSFVNLSSRPTYFQQHPHNVSKPLEEGVRHRANIRTLKKIHPETTSKHLKMATTLLI